MSELHRQDRLTVKSTRPVRARSSTLFAQPSKCTELSDHASRKLSSEEHRRWGCDNVSIPRSCCISGQFSNCLTSKLSSHPSHAITRRALRKPTADEKGPSMTSSCCSDVAPPPKLASLVCMQPPVRNLLVLELAIGQSPGETVAYRRAPKQVT